MWFTKRRCMKTMMMKTRKATGGMITLMRGAMQTVTERSAMAVGIDVFIKRVVIQDVYVCTWAVVCFFTQCYQSVCRQMLYKPG